jgi:hypothetical protein
LDKKKQKYISYFEFILIDKNTIMPPGYKKLVVFDDIHLKIKASDKDLAEFNVTEKDLLAYLISNDHIIKKLRALIQNKEREIQLVEGHENKGDFSLQKTRSLQNQKLFRYAHLRDDTKKEKVYLEIDIGFAFALNIGDKIWFDNRISENVKDCEWVIDTQKNYEKWNGCYLVTDRIFINDNKLLIRVRSHTSLWDAPY